MIDDTLAERGKVYGSFVGQAEMAQELKNVMRRHGNWHGMAPDQKEALEMIAHKMARAVNGNPGYIENYRDIEGYSRLVSHRLENTVGATDSRVTQITRGNDGWE